MTFNTAKRYGHPQSWSSSIPVNGKLRSACNSQVKLNCFTASYCYDSARSLSIDSGVYFRTWIDSRVWLRDRALASRDSLSGTRRQSFRLTKLIRARFCIFELLQLRNITLVSSTKTESNNLGSEKSFRGKERGESISLGSLMQFSYTREKGFFGFNHFS